MTPVLFKTKNCKFCGDVRDYANFAGVELEEKFIEEENPHGLRTAPVIAHEGELYTGLDECAAFLRRQAKRAA
ncbi:hypothetical protein [Pseudoalteromonas sp. GB43]